MRRRILAGVLLAGIASVPGVAVSAQADRAACQLPPPTLPPFGGTPVAANAATPTAPQAPPEAITEREITAALEQIVACVNTGDPALVFAVFTPQWIARQFVDPETHYLPAFARMLDVTEPVPAEPLALTAVEGITERPDGRVEVVATFASGAEPWRDTLVLVEIDDSWLIDGVETEGAAS